MRKPIQLGKLGRMALDYQSFVAKRPFVESSARAAIIGFVGDISAQVVIERQPIDWKRTLRLAGISFVVMGPMFAGGRKLFTHIFKDQTIRNNAIKELVGAVTLVPTVFATAIGTIGLVQNLKWDQIKSKVKDEIRYVVPVSWLAQGMVIVIILLLQPKLHNFYITHLTSEALFATFLSNKSNKNVQDGIV